MSLHFQNQSEREMDDDSSDYKQMNRYPLNMIYFIGYYESTYSCYPSTTVSDYLLFFSQ